MANHMWVEIKYTLVEPELSTDEEGRIDIHVTDTQLEVAEQEVTHGCWICSTPLNTKTIDEECSGSHDGCV